MSDVTQILQRIEEGDSAAVDQLLPLVYEELRKLAGAKLAREKPGQTLQATALVHEAYLRLVDGHAARNWGSSVHFYLAAAEAMRRILVDSARRKATLKRGGQLERVSWEDLEAVDTGHADRLLAMHEALDRLAAVDAEGAKTVQLRYFGGLTIVETAKVLGVSTATANRYWAYARAWLQAEIRAFEE